MGLLFESGHFVSKARKAEKPCSFSYALSRPIPLKSLGMKQFSHIKELVASKEGVCVADLAVYCSGRPLEDAELLNTCARDLQTLEVDIRMIGGKVHGS